MTRPAARAPRASGEWTVIDLFSGAGGMSCGFARRAPFRMVAAVDLEQGKPASGAGKLGCNATYAANIGVEPFDRDLFQLQPSELLDAVAARGGPRLRRGDLTVLACCPPCTDFSRAKPANHLADLPRNSLVGRAAEFVEALLPEFVVMENARELLNGRHTHHFHAFEQRLRALGYDVRAEVHLLTRFGLPQIRERALVVASRAVPARGLDDLWDGFEVAPHALTVRRAIGHLARPTVGAGAQNPDDPMHEAPGFSSDTVRRRLERTPHDGGSWFDLARDAEGLSLLAPSMLSRLKRGDLGSHPDVYGRLAWDKPAVTIKRECAHVGNGRYAHPEQTRLLTVREMALLQGFPADYRFVGALSNRYRHIGDAVPPLVSFQMSALVAWMKTGRRPQPREWVLPGTSLHVEDVGAVGRDAATG